MSSGKGISEAFDSKPLSVKENRTYIFFSPTQLIFFFRDDATNTNCRSVDVSVGLPLFHLANRIS